MRLMWGLIDSSLVIGFLMATGAAWVMAFDSRRPESGLVAQPAVLDLGFVNQQEMNPFKFELINSSSKDLVITEVTRPCSCTRVDLAPGTVLASGEHKMITGAVDSTRRRGVLNTALAIKYDLKGTHRDGRFFATVPIKLNIRPSIVPSAEPLQISGEGWSELELRGGTWKRFRITGVESSNPYIRWELVGSALNAECTEFRVRARLDAGELPYPSAASDGPHWLTFVTSNPAEPRFQVAIVISSAGP